MSRKDLAQAATDRESERFGRLRERRLDAFQEAYRASLDSVSELEEVTDNVESLRRKVTLLESVKSAHWGVKLASLVTALGGAAGLTELVRGLVSALRK